MDGFSGYNQIDILPQDQHKTTFICQLGTFAYKKLPFGLKNVGATFQRVMSYAFHDIKTIVQAYLDDLPAKSRWRQAHMDHFQQIFVCYRHYNIRLNPHKFIFGVESGCLLGFIVANDGIRVDPLKVEAIMNLPPPRTILHLQSLQGKANFLRRFIVNYAKITKGFMRLLKKGVRFIWDDWAQQSFDALKASLASTPVISPPNYQEYFLLYLAASDTTIGMVLVQTDGVHMEHVIYYLSCGFVGAELRYPYVEKLALAVAFSIQKFCHYIILRTSKVISDANPMRYILSRQILGG
jgi:hypothetical protein